MTRNKYLSAINWRIDEKVSLWPFHLFLKILEMVRKAMIIRIIFEIRCRWLKCSPFYVERRGISHFFCSICPTPNFFSGTPPKNMRFFTMFYGPNIRCFCGRISPTEFLLAEGFRRISGLATAAQLANCVKIDPLTKKKIFFPIWYLHLRILLVWSWYFLLSCELRSGYWGSLYQAWSLGYAVGGWKFK